MCKCADVQMCRCANVQMCKHRSTIKPVNPYTSKRFYFFQKNPVQCKAERDCYLKGGYRAIINDQ